MAAKNKTNDNEVIDPVTGEVLPENDPVLDFIGSYDDEVPALIGDEGVSVKGIVLPKKAVVNGVFLGFQPFVYLDQRNKKAPVEKVLNWIVLDALRRKQDKGKITFEKAGMILRVMESTRFMQGLAIASPGDRIVLMRNDKIVTEGKNDQWDDDVRVYPAEGRSITPITAAAPIRELDQFNAYQKRLAAHVPGARAEKVDSDDVG